MSSVNDEVRGFHGVEHGFPWRHVIGLILSIALTLFALWLVLSHVLSHGPLFSVILILAVVQIGIQLFFFMHITESAGPRYHVPALALGLFFTFCIIAGSIWIMTFGGYESY